jgi:hypothetical protein
MSEDFTAAAAAVIDLLESAGLENSESLREHLGALRVRCQGLNDDLAAWDALCFLWPAYAQFTTTIAQSGTPTPMTVLDVALWWSFHDTCEELANKCQLMGDEEDDYALRLIRVQLGMHSAEACTHCTSCLEKG